MVEKLNQVPIGGFELDLILKFLLLQTSLFDQWIIELEFYLCTFSFLCIGKYFNLQVLFNLGMELHREDI